jgi:hypothetical protein
MRLLGILVVTLAVAPALGCRGRDSVALTLENVGQIPLDSVVVFTTGRSYPIGSLSAGGPRRLMIGATGESHIEVEHGTQRRRRLVVDTISRVGMAARLTFGSPRTRLWR